MGKNALRQYKNYAKQYKKGNYNYAANNRMVINVKEQRGSNDTPERARDSLGGVHVG